MPAVQPAGPYTELLAKPWGAVQVPIANTIIGGTNRAGSTSLFRYLAAHPEVCPSSIKETHFFLRHGHGILPSALKEYESYFSHCPADCKVRLEATPAYLHHGKAVASAIAKVIPDAKLIFILRNPTTRFFTIFRNRQLTQGSIFGNLDFDDCVSITLKYLQDVNPDAFPTEGRGKSMEIRASRILQRSCYARFLPEFYSRFPRENICVLYFDDLVADPLVFVRKAAGFLDIDPEFYNGFEFRIANKTRNYRWAGIHRHAEKLNNRLEAFLNRNPRLRRVLGATYQFVNEKLNSESKMSDDAKTKLDTYFAPFNRDLHAILRQQVDEPTFPSWICGATNEADSNSNAKSQITAYRSGLSCE